MPHRHTLLPGKRKLRYELWLSVIFILWWPEFSKHLKIRMYYLHNQNFPVSLKNKNPLWNASQVVRTTFLVKFLGQK